MDSSNPSSDDNLKLPGYKLDYESNTKKVGVMDFKSFLPLK